MSDTFYFGKELKVYLESSSGKYWRISVEAPPTFSQSAATENVAVQAMPQINASAQTNSSYTLKNFKTEFNAAEWSFVTNIRPYSNSGNKQSAESILWEYFTGSSEDVAAAHTDNQFSLKETYPTFTLHFIYSNNKGYKITGCTVTKADINVDTASVGKIAWSGSGLKLEEAELAPPAQIENSAHLAGTTYLTNKFSTLTSALPATPPSGGLVLNQTAFGTTHANMDDTGNTISADKTQNFGINFWGVANSSRVVFNKSSFSSAKNWNDFHYFVFDTNHTGIGLNIYNKYVTATLKDGDQIKIQKDANNYGIYEIEKYHLPQTDETGGNETSVGQALGSLSLNNLADSGYINNAVDASHYFFLAPQTDNYKNNHTNVTNFNAKFEKTGMIVSKAQSVNLSDGTSKWFAGSQSIDQSKTEHTVSSDVSNSAVVPVTSTTGAAAGEGFYWPGIDYTTLQHNDVNEWGIKISSVDSTANTLTLTEPVTISSQTKVYTHLRPLDQADIGHPGYVSATHAHAAFGSGIWYVPKGYGSRITPLHDFDATYYADVTGTSSSSSSGGYQDASLGYLTGTATKYASTFIAATAGQGKRIRATKASVVGAIKDEGCLAANSMLASKRLARFSPRGHPTKFILFAPYRQPTYIKVYQYLQAPVTTKFVKKSDNSGYYQSDGSTEITAYEPTIPANMWLNQEELSFSLPLNDSDINNATEENAAYIIESDTELCGLAFGQDTFDGQSGDEDWWPLAPMTNNSDKIVTDDSDNYYILIDHEAGSANISLSDTLNSGINNRMKTGRISVSGHTGEFAVFQVADGSGGDGMPYLPATKLGDTYVWPEAILNQYEISAYFPDYTAGTGNGYTTANIYVRTAAQKATKDGGAGESEGIDGTSGTYIYKHAVTGDSTSLTAPKVMRGDRTGLTHPDVTIEISSTGTINAGNAISITSLSTITGVRGGRFQLNGTGPYYHIIDADAGNNEIYLEENITLGGSAQNITISTQFLENMTGPFFFEGNVPFLLVCQNQYEAETVMLGTRIVGITGSKRGGIDIGNTVVGPTQNNTFLRHYPLRASSIEASKVGGKILSLDVVEGGSGHSTVSGVTLLGGRGSGATANITASGGVVTSAVVVAEGSGYEEGDLVLLGSGASAALMRVTIYASTNKGEIHTLTITTPGSGFTNNVYSNISLTGGRGSGAVANITVTGGQITGWELTNNGFAYELGDTLGVTGFGGAVLTVASIHTSMVYHQNANMTPMVSGASYTMRSNYHYNVVSQGLYAMNTRVVVGDSDATLKLTHLDSKGTLGQDDVTVEFSRALGASNASMLSGFNFPVTSLNISLSVEQAPIPTPILSEVSYPIGFSRKAIQVSGTFNAYMIDSTSTGDTRKFFIERLEDINPFSDISLNIGGTTANQSLTISIPNAYLDAPTLESADALAFSCNFTGTSSGTLGANVSSIAQIKYN